MLLDTLLYINQLHFSIAFVVVYLFQKNLIFDIPVLLFFSARDDNNIASKSKYHASTVDS